MMIDDFRNLRVEKFLQGIEKLSFEMRSDDPKLNFIIEDTELLLEPDSGDRWYIDHFEDKHPGYRTVVCFATWMLLANRSRFGTFAVGGKTPHQGLELILTNSGWTAGDPPANASLYTMEEIDSNVLGLIWKWATITGYEVSFDPIAKEVTLVENVGEDRGYGFVYGHNIRQIERKFQGPEATRLYAVGANDLTVRGSNPTETDYIEDYSWYTSQGMTEIEARERYRKDAIWVDESFLLSINLFDAAVERLAILAQPRISYKGSVVDLTRLLTGDVEPRFFVGDTVRVKDSVLGIDVVTRITRIVRFPIDPKSDEIELGFSPNGVVETTTTSSRSTNVGDLTPIVHTNDTAVTVNASEANYNQIALTSAGNAVVLTGSTFVGVATGTGTVQFRMVIDGVDVGTTYSAPFTNGQVVEFSWPSFATDLPEGAHTIQWRARVSSGTGTILLAINGGRSWVLARGAVGVGGGNPSAFVVELLDGPHYMPMSDEEWVVEFISLVDIIHELEEELTEEYEPPTDYLLIPFTVGDSVFGTLGPGGAGRLI